MLDVMEDLRLTARVLTRVEMAVLQGNRCTTFSPPAPPHIRNMVAERLMSLGYDVTVFSSEMLIKW